MQDQTPKTSWINKVQEESWQAELLVSGAVIVALFYAPNFVITWLESIIYRADTFMVPFISMFSMFVMTGVYILIILLVIHFFIRAWWVAMLGLDFVFPNGVGDRPFMTMSKGVLDRYKRDLKAPKEEIKRLDDIGSLMFSVILTYLMIYFAISFWVIVIGLIMRIAYHFFPGIVEYQNYILLGLYILILIPAIKSYLRKRKKIESDEIDEKYYNFIKKQGKITYLIFYQPVTYTMTLIFSNLEKNKNIGWIFMAIMFVGSILASIHTFGYSIINDLDRKDRYVDYMDNRTFLDKDVYRNQTELTFPLHPSIQSDVIQDDYIKLFVPILPMDREIISTMGYPTKVKNKNPKKDSLRLERLKGYKEYVSVSLNQKELIDAEVFRTTLDHSNSNGLMYYIPTKNISKGRNELMVNKELFDKDSTQYKAIIPFMMGEK